MKDEFSYKKIELNDAEDLRNLALENSGNSNLNKKTVNHWYFQNPTNSNAMWKVEKDGKTEGYATTNNFKYNIRNKEYLVALPQNVLTSTAVRGKGLFKKLYYKTEEENLHQNKVDFFLTSTGAMSTPIFLEKFGYLRGFCPDVLIKTPSVLLLSSKKRYKVKKNISSLPPLDHVGLPNARKKEMAYFKWRYAIVNKRKFKVLEVFDKDNQTLGYGILIIQVKFGVKLLILADIITEDPSNYAAIIDGCHQYASKNFFVAMVMFELSCNSRNKGINISIKNRFNFLVKGKDQKETENLSQIKLNYFFGDLDYFW